MGDLGPVAVEFLDSLSEAGQSLWQMLPLTPPGASQSPFDCRSAFAGNWLLISPLALAADGLAPQPRGLPTVDTASADFGTARSFKESFFRDSWRRFQRQASAIWRQRLERFLEAPEQRFWLEDWALFAALDSRLAGTAWNLWPAELRRRDPQALARARHELADEIDYQRYLQFVFFRQFRSLRGQARERGIRLVGDLPIYVSHHSADVWAHPGLFELDQAGYPVAVAGVPPDAFSATGQRWGNPVYRWARHRESRYEWWIERLKMQASLTELLRLDHFRGFVAYWRVPVEATDARDGRWARGPGRKLFERAATEVESSALIAEDLGHITPAVRRLRDELGLRGMKVLQFAFGGDDSDHLPHHHTERSVVYTGTHDNDTLAGWWESLAATERRRVIGHLGGEASMPRRELVWELIGVALDSVAELCIVPMQDVLGLGSEGRMNMPGTTDGNWRWRMERRFEEPLGDRLRQLTAASGRRGLGARGLGQRNEDLRSTGRLLGRQRRSLHPVLSPRRGR